MKTLLLLLALVCATPCMAGELRDPMRPPQPRVAHGAHARAALPVLSAILTRDGRHKAIVDGRWVRAGDAVGGGKIVAISAEGVRWSRRGRVQDLRLPGANPRFKMPAKMASRNANGVAEHAP